MTKYLEIDKLSKEEIDLMNDFFREIMWKYDIESIEMGFGFKKTDDTRALHFGQVAIKRRQ